MTPAVQVWIELSTGPIRVGTAYFTIRRQVLSTAFRYDEAYLARPDAVPVDPGLPLHRGNHNVDALPGTFRDSSPDRWGRNLIARRLRAAATTEGRTPPSLSDVDFLLGVADSTRQGDLRFRLTDDGPFEHPSDHVPPLVELPRLLRAAEHASAASPNPPLKCRRSSRLHRTSISISILPGPCWPRCARLSARGAK